MRGVVFTGERQLELMTFPDPTPGPDEVVTSDSKRTFLA
jgi:hypothetical protein